MNRWLVGLARLGDRARVCIVFAVIVALAAPSVAQHRPSPRGFRDGPAEALLGTPLEPLMAYIGDWEVNAAWGDGTVLWARNEYRVLLGGAFVDVLTWARDGDGDPYLRYYTVYRWDAERERIIARGFQSDGSSEMLELVPVDDAEGAGFQTEWGDAPARIRQRVGTPENGAYRWRVWMIAGDDAEPAPIMDAAWIRKDHAMETSVRTQPPECPYPIDPTLFVPHTEPTTSFEITQRIEASPAAVFETLTTEAGIRRLFGVESRIDLAVGGPYEWYFLEDNPYGTKGGEGNQVLAFVPDRMLTVSWNAPPTQPESRAKRTLVILTFEAQPDGATLVRLVHSGFGPEPHWQETRAYFEQGAWSTVLRKLRGVFGG